MKQYPVHYVEYNNSLGLHDLTVGNKLRLGQAGFDMQIVESSKIAKGALSYAIVEWKHEDGTSKYLAYANNQSDYEKLMSRMKETYMEMNRAEKEINLDSLSNSNSFYMERDDGPYVSQYAQDVAKRIIDFNEKKLMGIRDVNLNNISVLCADGSWQAFKPEDIQIGWSIQIECTITDPATGEVNHGRLNIPNLQSFSFDRETGELLEFASRSKEFVSDTITFAMTQVDIGRDLNTQSYDFNDRCQ